MKAIAISKPVSDFARVPKMMVVGDVHQTSLTRSESFQNPSHAQRSSTHATPTQSSIFASSNGRSRASSRAIQPTQSVTASQAHEAPHIHFRGAPQAQHLNAESDPHYYLRSQLIGHESHPAALPPPSPRLEPTHRSALSLNGSTANSPSRIKVRDLSHIQSFASEEVLTRSRHPSRHSLRGRLEGGQQYEISAMPVSDIIEMVAGLLTKITATNDRQHDNLHKTIPGPDGTTGLSSQATSVLAFHGKNVPSISIASYLSRIHKYCPTTYEVFLSLLVYFDRMTEMVNSGALSSFTDEEPNGISHKRGPSDASSFASSITAVNSSPGSTYSTGGPTIVSPPGSDVSDDHDHRDEYSSSIPPTIPHGDAYDLSHFFVVDSFNIHRLVIAGVTCASKFFSDVFYTNSRYAKVHFSLFP